MIRPGDTLVVFDAIHVSGCSVSGLRKRRRDVEARGGQLTILGVGRFIPRGWAGAEALIQYECRERAKAAGRYKPGTGRPPKLDVAEVQRLKALGLKNEEIAERTGFSRSQVFRVLQKLKAATQPKAA
jgi:CRP-like cAMP-binding protein